MDIDWQDLRHFVAVLEHGTFSAAAAALGVGQATVSRRIAALEETVGHALFDRVPGGLVATQAAELMRPYAVGMAAASLELETVASGFEVEPEGVVRLAASPGAAVDLGPLLARELLDRYPEVRLEILSDNLPRDLARREADIAVRTIRPTSGDLIVTRLTVANLGLFASPEYIASLPQRPRLSRLDFIGWSEELAHIPFARWLDEHRRRPYRLTTNSFIAMRAAAVAGLGVVLIPRLQAQLAGLVEVRVRAPAFPEAPSFIVVHRAMRHVPRVRVVLELLTAAAAAIMSGADLRVPGWSR